MTEPPVLLDENVEHEVLYRLRNYGHTVSHIDLHAQLQKGDKDHVLAQYGTFNGGSGIHIVSVPPR